MAQPDNVNFTSLGTRDGMISNSVTAILKDRFGLMWFATNDGLNKFNGTNFTVYRHIPGDTTSLRSNEILALHEDRQGNLWVGTSGGALSMYDRQRDCFINYPNHIGDAKSTLLPTALIRSICSDGQGRIWMAQYEAPCMLDPATGQITRCDLLKYSANPSQKLSLYCVYADSHQRIWVGTDRGLFLYMPATRSFRQFRHREGDSTSISDDNVRTIAEDHQGDLWVGTGKGLCRLLPDAGRFIQFHEKPLAGPAASEGQINVVAVDKDGIVWVGTGDGLVVINPITGRSVTYRPDQGNLHSLTSEAVTCIYVDPAGIYWFGTFRGGIDKYDKNLNLFNVKMSDAFRDGGPQSTIVTSFAEQPNGNLWLSTDGGGIYSFDRKADRLEQMRLVIDGKPALPLSVLATCWTSSHRLYIGTYGRGLFSFDPETRRVQRLQTALRADDANANCIYCIWEDNKGQVWVGTNGSGISVLRNGKLIFRLVPNPAQATDIKLPVNGFIRAISGDADGNVWIGSHGEGLAVYDPQSGRFRVYNQDNGALPSNKVQAFLCDSKGRMWLGTYGGGLCVFDKSKDKFIDYSEKDGLQNTNVYSVVEDHAGQIWVSTNSGVSSLDVTTNVFRNFTPFNGLQSNNFVHASALRTSDGELFFGGQQGFNYFNPATLATNRNVPAVILTDLKVASKTVIPGKGSPIREQISVADEIQLDYKQNFALSFVALNYTLPHQNRYAYKLEGFDKEWVNAGGQNTAYYTNLDPGDYVFRVKASNNDGVWSKGDTTIRIHVRPPIWRTTYAYIVYVLVIGGLLFYSRHRGLKRVRRRFVLEQERMKLKFLTNLSHEFRTPISLIMGPVEQLLSEQRTGPLRDKLEMVRRNSRRLLNLVNQLLDFRKMEEQELKLQPTPGELVGYVREAGQSFSDLGERKHIRLIFETKMERFYALFDHDKIERIIFNLLSNAFKFTPEGGDIKLSLEQAPEALADGRRMTMIRVTDSGIGIPRDKQAKIFDRFFQHSSTVAILNQGTGIGLSITREFVLMHGGTIDVASEQGQGSVFTVSIPLLPVDAAVSEHVAVTDEGMIIHEAIRDAGDVPEENSSGDLSRGVVGVSDGDTGRQQGKASVRRAGKALPLILLVEDNEDFRFYLKDNLRREYEVLEAVNGGEGWQQALASHPQLIVSDITMPVMDGIELTRKLKNDKRTSHIPVILLTALTEEARQLEGLDTGANDYVTKPFSFELLNARIKALLKWSSKMKATYTKQVKVLTPEVAGESANEKLMKRVVECLEAHLQNPQLSVEFLGRELGMSRSTLYNKLLETTGETPVEYIRSFRLEKAAELLIRSGLSITEVAYEVGFITPNYFTRAFRTKYKLSPSEYASQFRGETKKNSRPGGSPTLPDAPQ